MSLLNEFIVGNAASSWLWRLPASNCALKEAMP